MEVIAKSKYIRMSSRKLRQVAEILRGLSSDQALVLLTQMGKRGQILAATLRQAIGNAKNKEGNDLKIKTITVDSGPTYKRFRAVSRGTAHSIKKRTSHITIVLDKEGEPVSAKATAGKKNGTKS